MKWHHATIRDSADFTPGSFRTIRTPVDPDGPRFVIGRLVGQTTTSAQAVLIPATWSHDHAREWTSRQGWRVLRWTWANPGVDVDRVSAALRRAWNYNAQVRIDIEAGNYDLARGATSLVKMALQSAAAGVGMELRDNPDAEQFTTSQTHIREAVAHLVQADRNLAAGNAAAALEAVESAAGHLDQALARLDPQTYGKTPPQNPCSSATNAAPAAWNPGPDDNPTRADPKLRAYWIADARKRGVPAVEWRHPTAGLILSSPKRKASAAKWQAHVGEEIKRVGGKVVRWYPVRRPATKRNPPASPSSNPRQLVKLGDVLELRFIDGKGFRWKRGEAAILAPPGAERLAAGHVHLLLCPVAAAKPAPGRKPGEKAAKTYQTWHAAMPATSAGRRAELPGPGEFGERIGRVKSIVYFSKKWGTRESYIHRFAEPYPIVSKGPRGCYDLHGGRFRVTSRGLVD